MVTACRKIYVPTDPKHLLCLLFKPGKEGRNFTTVRTHPLYWTLFLYQEIIGVFTITQNHNKQYTCLYNSARFLCGFFTIYSIIEIATISPPGMIKSDLAPYPYGLSTDYYINTTWTPTTTGEEEIMCFTAEDSDGLV